jgi:serine O-acetyltransferase
MAVYRSGRWRYRIRWAIVRKPLSFIYKLLGTISQILTGIELPFEVVIGRRFEIEYFGDIITSGDAVFGGDVLIRNSATVGLRHTGVRGAPVIGDRVDIGGAQKYWVQLRLAAP